MTRDAGTMAESTKEATEEGAKVTTVAEGADATAAPPAEDKKSMLMALGAPEEVADGAIASDGDGFKDSTTPTSMFYSLKVNDDAKPEWKDHYLAYTKGAKASKGHISVSHTYNEETREVICVESITGTDAMLNHIGNCLPVAASQGFSLILRLTPRRRGDAIAAASPRCLIRAGRITPRCSVVALL